MKPDDTAAAPRFDDAESETLERVEQLLARHPYMRVDLEAGTHSARALEDVLSARLGLLHARGSFLDGSAVSVARKLSAWETRLAGIVASETASGETWLRYETTLRLHPDPTSRPSADAEGLDRLTSRWELRRNEVRGKEITRQRLRQNRAFFRHGAMLPLYWLRRGRVRKRVPPIVLRHRELRDTFSAIEQVGPLVDNFAFAGKAGLPIGLDVALADLAFLYMQLADELLDELAAVSGGPDAAGRIVRGLYRADTTKRPLEDLSLGHLRRAGIDPDAHTTKFGMTIATLFEVLDQLGVALDQDLARASADVVLATHSFLHHCFQTYLDEIELSERGARRRADHLPLRDSCWHFYRKNNLVMMLWLDLRARLLGLNPHDHTNAIRQWGYLLAAFQIFDDLKDVALDLGRQPSYALQIAANDYPEELDWIQRRFGAQRSPLTRDEVAEVSMFASRTVRQCMKWSRLIALAHFDNTLLYAWDQRWQRSWTRRSRSFNPVGAASRSRRVHVVDRLVRALVATRETMASNIEDEHLAYALDTAAYDGAWRIYVALFPNLRAIYRFATLRMWMSASEKAAVAKRLLRRHPRARVNALLDLANGDVDHEVTRDRLESFTKLIEV